MIPKNILNYLARTATVPGYESNEVEEKIAIERKRRNVMIRLQRQQREKILKVVALEPISLSDPPMEPLPSEDFMEIYSLLHDETTTQVNIIVTKMMTTHDDQQCGTTEYPLLKFMKPSTEGKRVSARGGHAMAMIGSKLIFFGGHCYSGSDKFDYYGDTMVLDLKTSTWKKIKTQGRAPTPRYGHTLSVVGDKIFLFGGCVEGTLPRREIFCLDTEDWGWFELATRNQGPVARFGHAATVVGDKIVIHGGWDGKTCFDDLWVFDTTAKSWLQPTTGGRPPSARHGHTLELTMDGRIILFGGFTLNEQGHPRYLDDVKVLDISAMVWAQPRVGGIPIDPRYSMKTCMVGKYMISLGGYIRYRPAHKPPVSDGRSFVTPVQAHRVIALDTETMEWMLPDLLGSCPDDLYGHTMVALGPQIFIYGGWSSNRAIDELFIAEASQGFPDPVFLEDLSEHRGE